MNPRLALVVFVIGIAGLFYLSRDRESKISNGLWISAMWLWIACSRPPTLWFQTPEMGSPERYLEGSPLDRFIFSALLLAGVLVLVGRRQRVLAILKRNGPLLIFLSYCALSIIWSDYPDVAFKRFIKALGDLVIVLIVLTESDRLAAWKQLLARASFILVPVSVLFIKYFPELGRGYNRWSWSTFHTGVATGKNELGLICLICGLGAVWQLSLIFKEPKGSRRTRLLTVFGVILVMVLWLFRMADSMTSLSCFLFGLVLLFATSRHEFRRKKWIVHVLAFTMIVFSVATVFFGAASGLLHGVGRNETITGRTEVWSTVLSIHINPLFGTGFESFWLGTRLDEIWRMSWWHPNEAHNGYIEAYLNLGWVGVTLLAFVFLAGYANVLAAFRRDTPEGRIRVAFFVCAVTYNLTESAVRTMHPLWIIFLLTILAVPAPAEPEPPRSFSVDHLDTVIENDSEYDHALPAGSL
jgi:exopolysaccharide production protein ExoQ